MAFGISPSDILKTIEICIAVKHFCEDISTAETRRNEFRDEVIHLQHALERLRGEVEDSARAINFEPDNDLVQDVREAFQRADTTIKGCEELLRQNRERRTAWTRRQFNTGGRVRELRDQIKRHVDAIGLVVGRIHMRISQDTHRGVQFLVNQAISPDQFRNLPTPIVPVAVERRLAENLAVDAPDAFQEVDCAFEYFPLKEGYDALSRHCNRSAIEQYDPSIETDLAKAHLNLLKSLWILIALRNSIPFSRQPASSPLGLDLWNKERTIAMMLQQPSFAEFDEQHILALDDQEFCIWPKQHRAMPPDDIHERDEYILKLVLPRSRGHKQQSMGVHRLGRTKIGIDINTTFEAQNTNIRVPDTIDIHHDSLVPMYAIPGMNGETDAPPIIQIGHGRGQSQPPTAHKLMCEEDILKLQHALTEYEVVANVTNVTYRIPLSWRWGSDAIAGVGRVQLWRWKPMSTTSRSRPSDPDSSISLTRSNFSGATKETTQTINRVISSVDREKVAVMAASPQRTTLVAYRPRPPVLVIFTRLKEKLTIIHCEMRSGMSMSPAACRCNSCPDKCPITVIESFENDGTQKYMISKLSVEPLKVQELNLLLFAQPPHPQLRASKSPVKELNCSYISLEFADIRERIKFDRSLDRVCEERDLENGDVEFTIRMAKNMENQTCRVTSPPHATTMPAQNPTGSGKPPTLTLSPSLTTSDWSGFFAEARQ